MFLKMMNIGVRRTDTGSIWVTRKLKMNKRFPLKRNRAIP